MLTFFAPKQNEKFATIISGENIYSGDFGYGDVMSHRNIGMVFPTMELAELKLGLMKHIIFCTDTYGYPEIGQEVIDMHESIYVPFTAEDHFRYMSGMILPGKCKRGDINIREQFITQVNKEMPNLLREYKPAELENILNSY